MSPQAVFEPDAIDTLEPEVDLYPEVSGFSETLRDSLAIGIITVKALSDELALIPETVEDWANAVDFPHPFVQEKIIAFLEERRRPT